MRRRIVTAFALSLLALSLLAPGARAADAPRKITVGVLPFQAPAKYESLGLLAAAHVRSELVESPRYQLIEASRMDVVLGQIAASHRLDYSQRDAIESGLLLAARYIAFGEVISIELNPSGSLFPCDLSAALRLVQVETGVVVFQKITTVHGGQPTSCLKEALSELSCELLKSASLAGIVLEVPERDQVLLDLGSRDGIKSGQRLAVQREGGVVLNPLTGKELRRPDVSLGDIVVHTVGEETSIAKPVRSKDSDIHAGDRVLLPIAVNCSKLGSALRQAGTPLFNIIVKGIK